jgi:dipeptidyl aminopeptidase/acylaminoacyl peptidase
MRWHSSWLLILILTGSVFISSAPEVKAQPKPTASGKETGLIARDILFGNPSRSGAKISPDGKYLSYLAPVNGVMNVWVAPIDDLSQAKPVTEDKNRGIRTYHWTYTNKYLLYLQDVGGDEDWHVYRVDVTSSKTTDLTPLKKVRAEIDSVSHKSPDEILIGLNDRDPRYHDLYRLNLQTGDKELVQKNTEFLGFTTDDDYKVRFATKFSEDGGTVILQPDDKDGWKEFLRVPMQDSLTTSIFGFDRSGQVAYMIDSRKRNTAALTTLDLKTGEQKVIAENKQADISDAMLHPTENTVQAVSFEYERTRREFLDPKIAEDFERLKKIADGDITLTSRTLDDRKWVVAFLMDNGPVRYYLYDRDSQKARFLFNNRDDLEGLPLQKMHPVVIPSRDRLNLVCYLTLPPGSDRDGDARPDSAMPMVLLVHGGPWARDKWGYNPLHQFLANRGYAVLSVNFRGSTGLGKDFLNAGNKEWAGKMHDDLLDAVAWAKNEKIAIPDKIAIMGGSYGGYATLVGLTFTPDTFACGVDIVGPSNIVTLLNTIPAYWAPALQIFKDRVGDHLSEAGKAELLKRSPLTHVDKIRKPLLIGQGANDPRVKQAESDQIVKAMQEKKIPVTYVLFPDEGHGFARPENKLAFYAVTEAFLAGHLGGRYQAIGAAFEGSSITVPTGAKDVPGLAGKVPVKKESK